VALYYRSIRTQLLLPAICDAIRAKLPRSEIALKTADSATTTLDDAHALLKLAPLDATRERACNLTMELRFDDYEKLTAWNALLDALHESPKIRFASSYHFASDLPLAGCCARICDAFSFPPFELDGEDASDWGFSENDVAIVHVSRAHRMDTLHEWNPRTCPPQCNYHVAVDVKSAAPRELDESWLRSEWRPGWTALLVEIAGRVFDGSQWLKSSIQSSR
jgi:hypothetical protein